MQILSSNVYVGPNLYANFPVIKLVIDIGILEEYPSMKLGEAFITGLIKSIPTLEEHTCSYGKPGGLILRLRDNEGTWIGHIWEHVAIELQDIAGAHVSFGKTRSTGVLAHYNMIFEYHQRDVGIRAAELGRDLLISLMPQAIQDQLEYKVEPDFDFEYQLKKFIKFAQSKEFGPSTQSLVDAGLKKNIPYLRLNDQSLVQLGYGKHRQMIRATITSNTRDIAVDLACDKSATNVILATLGLPVPKQMKVTTIEQATAAAKSVGFPVVIKPLDGNHGRGVCINLKTIAEVEESFHVANKISDTVIVESYITGFDHRMLVVNGKLVAVAKRVPGHVVGDGVHNIRQLVDIVNQDPRRGVGHEKVLTQLIMDHQAHTQLKRYGFTEDTILAQGELCYLRETGNLSTGGTAIDLTDSVHPDNKEMAERAILSIGLDVGGVDFMIDDISKSYLDIGGGIVELNAAPGFRMHIAPTEGKSRDVAGAVIDMLFPDPEKARIPIVAITGTNGKTTTSRMVAHIWKMAGKVVGLTTTDGIYVNGRMTVKGDTTGPKSANMVLQDPTVEVAVLETARGGLLRSGLAYQYSNVGVCINVTNDHIGLHGINNLHDLMRVKKIVTDSARDSIVLNADDKYCLKMAETSRAKKIFYVTLNPQHDLVKQHIRSGGGAVILERGLNGDMITIFDNNIHIPVLWTHLIPATLDGRAVHNVQNAMFAIATAYTMGLSLDEIRGGMKTFTTSFYQTPGRFNLFEGYPFKVLLDYAHNPAALDMLCQFVAKSNVMGNKTCIIGLPGDRNADLIEESVKVIAGKFDHYIIKEDDNNRGKERGSVASLLQELLLKNGVTQSAITVVLSEVEAITHGLTHAKSEDFLVVLGDKVERSWEQIINFKPHNVILDNGSRNNVDVVVDSFYKDAISDIKTNTSDSCEVSQSEQLED